MPNQPLALRTESKQERAQATIETIIEAAMLVVEEKGLTAASPTTIAKRSGFSIGTIYRYFNDKDSIFIAAFDYVINRQHAGMIEKIQCFPSSGTSKQFAMCVVSHYLQILHRRNPKFVIPVFRGYLKRTPAPEKFIQHIDVLLVPVLELIKRNTSNTFAELDSKSLKLCLRAIATLVSASFYEEEPHYDDRGHEQFIVDATAKLLTK
jgi:AcrR family transcriptional regulator